MSSRLGMRADGAADAARGGGQTQAIPAPFRALLQRNQCSALLSLFLNHSHLICSRIHSSPFFAIMNASSSQAKVPTARQIRKAEKLEKRASMHGSRHPARLDGAIGRLTQVYPCFFS
jgi:hypothetical protein